MEPKGSCIWVLKVAHCSWTVWSWLHHLPSWSPISSSATSLTKAFDCVDHSKLENSSRNGNTRTLYLPPEKSVWSVKKQQLELDMEQWTGSKLGKEYIKVLSPCSFNLPWEMLGWMKHKLESRLLGEILTTSDMQMTPPLWQKTKRNWRASWWKCKGRVK